MPNGVKSTHANVKIDPLACANLCKRDMRTRDVALCAANAAPVNAVLVQLPSLVLLSLLQIFSLLALF
jgi:hypothetical protein